MIKENWLIKHKNSMDVCFDICDVVFCGNKLILWGFWINMGYEKSWVIDPNCLNKITIEKSKVTDLLCTDDRYAKCFRYCDWKEVV